MTLRFGRMRMAPEFCAISFHLRGAFIQTEVAEIKALGIWEKENE